MLWLAEVDKLPNVLGKSSTIGQQSREDRVSFKPSEGGSVMTSLNIARGRGNCWVSILQSTLLKLKHGKMKTDSGNKGLGIRLTIRNWSKHSTFELGEAKLRQ